MASDEGSSSSEEYVSADEGPDVFQDKTTVAKTGPPSVPSSPSLGSDHVTRTNQSPTSGDQLGDDRDSPLTNKQETNVVRRQDNTIEPHPPQQGAAGIEDHSEPVRIEPSPHSPSAKLEDTFQSQEKRLPVVSLLEGNGAPLDSDAGLNGDVTLKSHDQTKSETGAVELYTVSGDIVDNVCLGDVKITAAPEVSSVEGSTTAVSGGAGEGSGVEKDSVDPKSKDLKKKREGEGEDKSEEKVPVPPPRRKRKNKKMMNKQPSLENLREKSGSFSLEEDDSSVLQRSMTVSSTDFKRERKKERPSSVTTATEQSSLPHSPSEDTKPSTADTASPGLVSPETDSSSPKLSLVTAADLSKALDNDGRDTVKSKTIGGADGPFDRSLRSSRSVTPTPAISIEPDGSLELTADMLNGLDSEVITSDTLQSAKARGSNNTGLGVIIPSDDESVDILIGDEEEEREGERQMGEEVRDDSEGEMGGATMAVGGVGEGLGGVSADSLPGSTPNRTRAVKQGSEEEEGRHDHERTPQPTDPQEKTLELVDGQAEGAQAADTGSSPTDNAILESTMITNLDTGEVMPLSAAEERIPRGHGWSPLSEHLLRRTNQMTSDGHLPPLDEDDMEDSHQRGKIKKRLKRFTKWGKRKSRHGDSHLSVDDETMSLATDDQQHTVKYKNSSNKQGQLEFERVRLKQDLTGQHLGAVWSMEFSICGRLLATAGQDSVVRVWVLRTAYHFFHELQSQYQRLGVHSSVDSLSEKASMASNSSKSSEEDDVSAMHPFLESPLCAYYGHTADILDISWSKNFFLLSSSMDKTVRLWHISRKECLCCFQHVDFVTAIAFHPRDDRYFLSGSLDGKLRLWNIPDKKVALWNEIEGVGSHLITAANFCMNGKLAVVGTYDGRCIFYETEHLKYHTQIHVRSRHGKNRGRKISGVEPLPGEDKLLVTSNDSRIRLYNLKDHSLSCKYKGCLNTSSQIKATFSRDGQYIISGSEDNFVYVWKTHIDMSKMPSRRDRNEFYESFSTHSAPVTTAVFAPVPGIIVDQGLKEVGEMIVAADYQGCIKIYVSNENL